MGVWVGRILVTALMAWWLGWWLTLETFAWQDSDGQSVVLLEATERFGSTVVSPMTYYDTVAVDLITTRAHLTSLTICVVLLVLRMALGKRITRMWTWASIVAVVLTWIYLAVAVAGRLDGVVVGTPLDLVSGRSSPDLSGAWPTIAILMVLTAMPVLVTVVWLYRRPLGTRLGSAATDLEGTLAEARAD